MKLLEIDDSVRGRFPTLKAILHSLTTVVVERNNSGLEEFKKQIFAKIRDTYNLEALPQVPIFRAYRDFFWRIGVDPTKIRPAAEALVRRILAGKSIPSVNTLVDAYNLSSAETGVALAAFDSSKIRGNMIMRFARDGEKFLGIGMEEPMILHGGEVVVSDNERLAAVYPYRDADYSKITLETENAVVMVCGVPGVDDPTLENTGEVAVDYITRFCSRR